MYTWPSRLLHHVCLQVGSFYRSEVLGIYPSVCPQFRINGSRCKSPQEKIAR